MENTQAFAFDVLHQDRYSRGQLLLRTFLGNLYMVIPHLFVLFFLSIVSGILGFIAWWAILFTGRYPRSFFDFQVSILRWSARLQARVIHLADGYPAFGMSVNDDRVLLHIAYPERQSRSLLLVRLLFQFVYVVIPHGICLFFRVIATAVVIFIAWWAVLITGEYPPRMHAFVVGTMRWITRVNIYISFLTDKYPPFSGKP